jgi:dihydrodipicolinate synthase/N-acetylneuraminate lyase
MDPVTEMSGVIGVINTPFKHDDTIDGASLDRYVEHALASGVCGFLVLGMAAEPGKLSTVEKDFIVERVLRSVEGRVPVICGVDAPYHQARLQLARRFVGMGCDGVMVNVPFTDEEHYRRQIIEIAQLEPQLLMIQDWDFEGPGIPIPVITRLFNDVECFRSYKVEVSPAGVKYTAALEATGHRMHVAGGWAVSQMVEALDRGVHAFMSTIMHGTYREIFQFHHAGRREEAKARFYAALPVLAFSHQHLDISIHFNKRFMHRLGVFSTDRVREPILLFDRYHRRVADQLIDLAMEMCVRIPGGGVQ